MFSSNKTFDAFDRSQKPFGFVSINKVLRVLLMSDKLQVIYLVVSAVKVFVIYLQSAINTTVKRFPHHSMHRTTNIFSVFAQGYVAIAFHKVNFYGSVISVANPRFATLDRMRRSYAGAQKLSNLFKGCAVLKHLLGFGNFGGIKRFASGNPSHVTVIADLVQIFKVKNWFPRFHA